MLRNLDLNQGPAGYEGDRLSYYPIPFNRYEQDDKAFMAKMLLEFNGFNGVVGKCLHRLCTVHLFD